MATNENAVMNADAQIALFTLMTTNENAVINENIYMHVICRLHFEMQVV